MANATDTVKVGRVFFKPEKGPDIEKVTVLTLDSHVENVVELVNRFDSNYFDSNYSSVDCKETRDWLIRAAQKHDEAKPETFRVTYRGWKQNGRNALKSLGYSFAGHRFRVSDNNRYVELLIRLHHEFSVEGIVNAKAQLKALNFDQIDRFPIDLYTLEMCDQIEAEAETYAFTGDVQPRVFMDFHSRMQEDGKIEVNPYPFIEKKEISLYFTYYEFSLPKTESKQIAETLRGDNPKVGERHLTNIIVQAHNYTDCRKKKVILCKAQ